MLTTCGYEDIGVGFRLFVIKVCEHPKPHHVIVFTIRVRRWGGAEFPGDAVEMRIFKVGCDFHLDFATISGFLSAQSGDIECGFRVVAFPVIVLVRL